MSQVLASQYGSRGTRLAVVIAEKNVTQGKFKAVAHGGWTICASGVVSEILSKVVKENRTYFISDGKHDNEVVELTLFSEFSRFKPSGVLFERFVNVDYLLKMQQERVHVANSELMDERYYIKAVVAETTQEPERNLYQACPNPECRGCKVIPIWRNGWTFFCPKCYREGSEFDWRIMPKVELVDPSDSINSAAPALTAAIFKQNAERLLGEMEENIPKTLKEGQVFFGEVFNFANGQEVVLRLRCSLFKGAISFSVDELL